MSDNSRISRITIFLFGLSVGLLAGAGFFIFKIDEYISKIELFKDGKDTIIAISQNNQIEVKKESEKKGKANSYSNSSNSNTYSSDNGKIVSSDSIKTDSTFYSGDDIVVVKDEMISYKIVNVEGIRGKSTNGTDSILEKESGLNKNDQAYNPTYKVEFWQSPINYKGYKLLKNKLILFGLSNSDGFKIYKLEEALYFKINQQVFRIEPTNDFKPYETVKDQLVLAKLQ